MKRTLLVILTALMLIGLTACSNDKDSEDLSSAPSMTKSTETVTVSSSPDPSLSATLSSYLEGSFGGDGKPEYAASWYHHISKVEVSKSNGTYCATVTLRDDSVKYSKSLKVLETYFTSNDIDNFFAGMCGAAEKFDLDSADLALLGEAFYNIANKGDSMYYYSVQSLGVPIFSLLSGATGQPESRIKSDIESGAINGQQAASVALTAMDKAYSGDSKQVTNKELNTIARTIMANFRDVDITQVNFIDKSGFEVKSIKNY